jgi:hypothetical protein
LLREAGRTVLFVTLQAPKNVLGLLSCSGGDGYGYGDGGDGGDGDGDGDMGMVSVTDTKYSLEMKKLL